MIKYPTNFDVIVIGSGMGGLTVASLLAQMQGKRVLVLERHYQPGGFTHAFTRPGGYKWDVGLHYVGGMAPGAQSRRLMDLVTGGSVEWHPMPSPFETFSYPGLTFEVPDSRAAYQRALEARFPQERQALRRYFNDVSGAAQWAAQHMTASSVPWFVNLAMRAGAGPEALALSTTQAYLETHVADPQLRAVLASQWGDYGLPPSQSAFAIHSLIAHHYFNGGWYPVGGAGRIAQGAVRQIEASGGRCLVGHRVDQIVVDDGRASGVCVSTRRGPVRFTAPVVVSDAGAHTTFEALLPAMVPLPFRDALRGFEPGQGVVTLYLGLKRSAATLGFTGGNHWLYSGFDHDAMFADRNGLLDGRPAFGYLSFPSLKDPQAEGHTAEIISYADYDAFSPWRTQPWRRRDPAYQALKATIAQGLLDLVEQRYPGFRELVAFCELSTPLSVEHFTGHARGAIYGVPATPDRFRQPWLKPQTPVPGLYLTGADAGSLGIVGAMMGGVATAAVLQGGMGFINIMRQA